MTGRVAWISYAPVKSLALALATAVDLDRDGIRGDRDFFLVDESGRMTNNKRHGPLQAVVPTLDTEAGTLTLRFPDGREIVGETTGGAPGRAIFYDDELEVEELSGHLSDALSDYAGAHIRIVAHRREGGGGDRGVRGATSLVTTGSLDRLARELDVDVIDPRRFRMHFVVDGFGEHEEDGWTGRRIRLGDAVVVPRGNVGRCAVTTQNPDTGRPNLDTLKAIRRYRGDLPTSEPLAFGVHAEVVEPGRVAVGDPVEPL